MAGGGGSSFGKRFAAEVALRRCLSMPELCLYGVHPLIGGAADADESFGEPREALGISHARDRHGNKYMNQYLAVAPVGHGAFGEVHLCLDTLTHRPYAVKHIPPSSVGRRFGAAPKSGGGGGAAEVAADPAHAEIAVMKKLTHDHVVRLHEVLRNADGAVYIVMEFVPGGPLLGAAAASDARALERGVPPLAEGDARRHFCDAACGLAYLHAVGVTHGDIKPSNLLLTSHGRLKIADFGVSSIRRVAARDDERGAGERQEGTPLFTAPELISDDAPIAPPSDVWALGVTLWVIVFGTPPFRGRTLMELYGAIEHAPLDLPDRRRRRPRRAAARAARTQRRGAHHRRRRAHARVVDAEQRRRGAVGAARRRRGGGGARGRGGGGARHPRRTPQRGAAGPPRPAGDGPRADAGAAAVEARHEARRGRPPRHWRRRRPQRRRGRSAPRRRRRAVARVADAGGARGPRHIADRVAAVWPPRAAQLGARLSAVFFSVCCSVI